MPEEKLRTTKEDYVNIPFPDIFSFSRLRRVTQYTFGINFAREIREQLEKKGVIVMSRSPEEIRGKQRVLTLNGETGVFVTFHRSKSLMRNRNE